MLVENKFIFLGLPRCASTSFHISFINHGFDVKYATKNNLLDRVKKFRDDDIVNLHETVEELVEKFGNTYPIVSIKRNPYERYLSMWKHVIGESIRYEDYKCSEVFSNLEVQDILCYSEKDVADHKKRDEFIRYFLNRNGLKFKEADTRVLTLLNVLITPVFIYHKNSKMVKWFDFKDLTSLEKWISDSINRDFKVLSLNSSKSVECKMELNQKFISLYDSIYSNFENHKDYKTII